jgi:hypothetical protein
VASLGALVIELSANTARLQSDLGKAVSLAQNAASKFASVFKGVAALAGAGSLGEVVTRSIELGDTLNKAAIKAGITGRAMSELAYAAKLSDVDIGSLSTALKKMQIALSEAASGGKDQNLTLQALGLTIRDLKGLSPEKQFELLGDRINRLKDPSDRARAAVELFGKAGSDLLPLFEQGAEGIRKAREEAQKLGASFSDDQIKKLADADDAIKRLKASAEAFALTLTAKAAPALTTFFNTLSGERITELKNEIEALQKFQGRGFFNFNWLSTPDIGMGFHSAEEGGQKLLELQRRLAIAQGEFVGHRGGGGTSAQEETKVPGFVDQAALEKAAKDYQTFSDAIVKSADEQNDVFRHNIAMQAEEVSKSFQDQIDSAERRDKYFQEGLENWKKLTKETTDSISDFARRAAENMQDAFANFLFDPFHDGLKGMLKSFIDTIRRMIAEAAAAKIFDSIGGVKGVGKVLGGFASSLFGGFKAEGGPLNPGKWYVAGEHGPEPVWGGGAGAFAMGYGRSGGGVNFTYAPQIDARGATIDLARALPGILDSHGKAVENRIVTGLRNGRYDS